MRILFLGVNYSPEVTGIGHFTAGVAEHFADLGHQVTAVTKYPHYPQWRVAPEHLRLGTTREQLHDVDVVRLKTYIPSKKAAVGRIRYDTSFAVRAWWYSKELPFQDLLIAVSPPVQLALVGRWLARQWGSTTTILRIHDLPTDLAEAVGLMRPGVPLWMAQRFEQRMYRKSTSMVVVSEGIRQRLLHYGVPDDRISVIPVWTTIDPSASNSPKAALDYLGLPPGSRVVLHAGNLGEKQGVAALVEAFLARNDLGDTYLILVGDGTERSTIQALLASNSTNRVRLIPLLPQDLYASMLAAAEILLLKQRPAVTDSVAPGKLLAYMAAGKAVVAAIARTSESARQIQTAGCGYIVDPTNMSELLDLLVALRQNGTELAAMGARGRVAVDQFRREVVLGAWDELLVELIARRKSKR